jgi:undecaprenyl diphosphate synthase
MAKRVEEVRLPLGTKVPSHIALILDGNRRWARARGLQPWEGHKAGYEAVRKLADASRKLGVHTFTVWAFSTENWERPAKEIEEIFRLLRVAIKEFDEELSREKVRFIHLGRKDRLPEDVVKGIAALEDKSRQHTEHTFNLCLDYGGRDEIIRAINKIPDRSEVTEKEFEKYLDTGDQLYPYVDLFIRTSGEQRTSGLLPWQMTYAEMYWEPDHLPDFTAEKLKGAILDFSRRRRRFGANDQEEHLQFDPKVVARLEIDLRKELINGGHFSDLVIRYLKEQYGLSKELAIEGGKSLAKALVYRRQEDWAKAREALRRLYELIRKNVGLAMEPEVVANIEVDMWRNKGGEVEMRQLLAEKFRFSDFQAAKSAHLAYLAEVEAGKGNWEKAKGLMERYYEALKERVA